jgi:hypothetical protein
MLNLVWKKSKFVKHAKSRLSNQILSAQAQIRVTTNFGLRIEILKVESEKWNFFVSHAVWIFVQPIAKESNRLYESPHEICRRISMTSW